MMVFAAVNSNVACGVTVHRLPAVMPLIRAPKQLKLANCTLPQCMLSIAHDCRLSAAAIKSAAVNLLLEQYQGSRRLLGWLTPKCCRGMWGVWQSWPLSSRMSAAWASSWCALPSALA